MQSSLDEVRRFWNSGPCQANLSNADDRMSYFREISNQRYARTDRHVPTVAKFDSFRGKSILEIGCGIATDGLEFARNGALYVGVDLTPQAIELAKERFGLFSVDGQFRVANAEDMPFPDCSFDHVYSFGVIHHSPSPEKIVGEIHRILRTGGTFTVMLYNKTSINYYLEIMFLRRIFRWLLLPGFMPRLVASVTGFDQSKLEGHRQMLKGRGKFSKEEWISMNTDGPFCPLARVYDSAAVMELFRDFGNLKQEIWEFNVEHWPFIGRAIPMFLKTWLGRHYGWHRMIYGQKL